MNETFKFNKNRDDKPDDDLRSTAKPMQKKMDSRPENDLVAISQLKKQQQ
jgi:hypothetical protein